MENPENQLASILAEPTAITLSGQTLHIKKLAIGQLLKAVALAADLFKSDIIRFTDIDFVLELQDSDLTMMQNLIALMIVEKTEIAALSIADFLKLFEAVMKNNEDFFLLMIRKATMTPPTPPGLISSTDLKAPDTVLSS